MGTAGRQNNFRCFFSGLDQESSGTVRQGVQQEQSVILAAQRDTFGADSFKVCGPDVVNNCHVGLGNGPQFAHIMGQADAQFHDP
ncbi:hypothetical protein ADUPG1_005536, partial [Aduncisulcus paluster]